MLRGHTWQCWKPCDTGIKPLLQLFASLALPCNLSHFQSLEESEGHPTPHLAAVRASHILCLTVKEPLFSEDNLNFMKCRRITVPTTNVTPPTRQLKASGHNFWCMIKALISDSGAGLESTAGEDALTPEWRAGVWAS